jgi:hypothetical protein
MIICSNVEDNSSESTVGSSLTGITSHAYDTPVPDKICHTMVVYRSQFVENMTLKETLKSIFIEARFESGYMVYPGKSLGENVI